MTTLEKLHEMLTENTGRHFLDSGDHYGRHWQRNQAKTLEDFINEPEETISYQRIGGYFERTVSVFHFLSELELCDICEEFNRINEEADEWDNSLDVYGVSWSAWEYLTNFHEVDVERTWNTYNGDSDLSQTLQGATLEIDGEGYFLIQIHGGCDVRGGYTTARLFRAKNGYKWEPIHEYLWEFKSQDEIIDDIDCGHLEEVLDSGNDYKPMIAYDAACDYWAQEEQRTKERMERDKARAEASES